VNPRVRPESFDPHTFPLDPQWFEHPSTIHGLSHTRRVLIHAHAIAGSVGLEPAEFEALVHAVAWHDIGRTHDGHDPEHGAKSVARIARLGLARGIHRQILARVLFAIELHSTHDEAAVERAAALDDAERRSFLRVIWTLKDADGLDRVRIHDLDPSQLRFPVSRERVELAWKLLEEMP
jgi:HD superfamily phosphodiesterase